MEILLLETRNFKLCYHILTTVTTYLQRQIIYAITQYNFYKQVAGGPLGSYEAI